LCLTHFLSPIIFKKVLFILFEQQVACIQAAADSRLQFVRHPHIHSAHITGVFKVRYTCDISRISWISLIVKYGLNAFTKVVILSVSTVCERPDRSASLTTLKFPTRKPFPDHVLLWHHLETVNFTNPTSCFCSVKFFMKVVTHYMP